MFKGNVCKGHQHPPSLQVLVLVFFPPSFHTNNIVHSLLASAPAGHALEDMLDLFRILFPMTPVWFSFGTFENWSCLAGSHHCPLSPSSPHLVLLPYLHQLRLHTVFRPSFIPFYICFFLYSVMHTFTCWRSHMTYEKHLLCVRYVRHAF